MRIWTVIADLTILHFHDGTPEQAKIKELERIIGKQMVTIAILKKIQQMENE